MAERAIITPRERELLYEDMHPLTREAADYGDTFFKKLGAANAKFFYGIGVKIMPIMENSDLSEAQKKQEVSKLATYWNQTGISEHQIYNFRNVVATFDEDFIIQQIAEPCANGDNLTFAHFIQLQKTKGDEKSQLAILKKVRKHSWSSNDLEVELSGTKKVSVKRSGGRKQNVPTSAPGIVKKLHRQVQSASNYLELVSPRLSTDFLEIPPDKITPEFVETVEEAESQVKALSSALKEATQNLKAVHKRCVKVLSKAQAAEQQYAVAAKAAEPDYPADRPPVKGRVLKKKKRVTRNELIDGTGTDTSSSGMRRGRRRPRRSAE